jgi:hypothetical protein
VPSILYFILFQKALIQYGIDGHVTKVHIGISTEVAV